MPDIACRGRTYRLFCWQHGLHPVRLAETIAQRKVSQFLPVDEQIARQRVALRETLENAAANVPYYRDLFAGLGRPANFASVESLQRVPILTRETLVQAPSPQLFLNERANERIRWSSSSGTSGRPVRSGHDAAARHSAMASRARAMAWFGTTPWDRQGMFVSQSPSALRKMVSTLIDRCVGRCRNGGMTLDATEAAAFARRLNRFRPAVLLGQPSLMNRLLHGALEAGLDVRSWGTRLLLANSEVLTDHTSRKLAAAFGCPVLNEYGCTEVGSMAHRCKSGMLHLNPEHALVELVDDEGCPVPAGVPGRVLLTTLAERTMPLIRYAVSDVAVWADQPCDCGFQPGLRGLSHVEGRGAFVWRDADGKVLSSREWLEPVQQILESAGYWECQFLQTSPTAVEIRVHPTRPLSGEQMNEIAAIISLKVGATMKAEALGREIHRTRGGKLAVVCRV